MKLALRRWNKGEAGEERRWWVSFWPCWHWSVHRVSEWRISSRPLDIRNETSQSSLAGMETHMREFVVFMQMVVETMWYEWNHQDGFSFFVFVSSWAILADQANGLWALEFLLRVFDYFSFVRQLWSEQEKHPHFLLQLGQPSQNNRLKSIFLLLILILAWTSRWNKFSLSFIVLSYKV